MPSDPPPTLTAKVQLQYDYSAQTPMQWALGAMEGTIRDELSLHLYFIRGSAIMTLKECNTCSANATPDWIVTDTDFPATPITLHTLILYPLQVEVVTVLSDAGDVWYLRSDDPQHPKWQNISKPSLENSNRYRMVDAKPFLDANGKLFISLLVTDKDAIEQELVTNIYIFNPTEGSWKIDQAIDLSDFVMKSFIPNAIFGSADNNSKYGFLVCGDDVADNTPGIAILTGGTPVLNTTIVAEGNYDSACFIQFPFLNTPPLIFALDSKTRKAVCFSRVADSTIKYSKMKLFENVSLRQIQAVLRVNSDDKPYLIELYAVTEADQLLHIISEPFDETTIRTNGKLTYPKLRSFIFIESQVKSMFVASSKEGFAALMIVKTDDTLVKMVRDDDATSWSSHVINEPALDNVQKKRVYYIEITAKDSINRVPAVGWLIAIGSIEYANIVVNGYAVVVNPHKRYQASTNGYGTIAITIAADSLATPTLTMWTDGMRQDQTIDIQAKLGIQERFKTITAQELKDAKNQETGQKLLGEGLSSATVQKLATSLQTLMKAPLLSAITHPTSSSSTTSESAPEFEQSMVVVSNISRIRLKDHLSEESVNWLEFDDLSHSPVSNSGDQPLDLPWGDIFLSIKNKIYTLVDVVVGEVKEGVKVILRVVADGVTYAWNSIVQAVRQAFDAVDALFTCVGCGFQDLFGWLAYLLDWKDIKATALIFKNYIANFKSTCTDWLDHILPMATSDFLKSCEDKLGEAFDSAKGKIGDEKIGKYDETDETTLSGSQGPDTAKAGSDADAQTIFDNLPSTVTWLQTKFMNGSGGDPNAFEFSRSLETLQQLFDTFRNSLTAFFSDDLKSAAKQFMDLLLSFIRRDTIDNTKITALLDAVKSALITILKTLSNVINALAGIGKESLNFLDEILNAQLWPSALGSIFNSIFDVDLTLENAICYSIAVPFTVMHKIITGYSPSDTTTLAIAISAEASSGRKIKRSLVLWRSILAFIHTVPDSMLDLMGVGAALTGLEVQNNLTKLTTIPKQLANGAGLIVPILDWIWMDPASMWKGTARQKVAVSIPAAVIDISIVWLVQTQFQRGPRGDLAGQIFLSTAGVLGLGTAVWYVFEAETVDIALAMAQFLRPLSLSVKIVRQFVQKTKNPKLAIAAGAIMVLVDSVSGLGSASAWYAAYKQET